MFCAEILGVSGNVRVVGLKLATVMALSLVRRAELYGNRDHVRRRNVLKLHKSM